MHKKVYFVDIEIDDAKICFFDFQKSELDFPKIWHTHIFYELHFSFEKTVEFKFKEQNVTLNPGELLIIPPDVLHESVTYKQDNKNFKVLSLQIEKKGPNKSFYNAFINALHANALKPLKISDINKDAVFSFGNEELYDSLLGLCKLKIHAAEVVYALVKKTLKDTPVKSDYNKTKIIIDYMLSSPEVSLREIAEATNYSQRQVSRIIKEQYGTTFSKLHQRRTENGGSFKE